MESISERLKGRLLNSGMTAAELAKKIGVNRSTVHFWLTGKFSPAPKKLHQIANALDVSPHWLVTGQVPSSDGSIYNLTGLEVQTTCPPEGSSDEEESIKNGLPPYIIQMKRGEENPVHSLFFGGKTVAIPVVPYDVFEDEPTRMIHMLTLPVDLLRARMNSLNLNHLEFVQVTSDSMVETLPLGSAVLLDKSVNEPRDNGVYAFKAHGRKYILRLQINLDGTITASSDNKKYGAMTIPQDEAVILGKCVMLLKLSMIS